MPLQKALGRAHKKGNSAVARDFHIFLIGDKPGGGWDLTGKEAGNRRNQKPGVAKSFS